MLCCVYVNVIENLIEFRHIKKNLWQLTLKRLYGLNCRTSFTTYCEKNEWLRTSVAVYRCFGSTTSIREIWGNHMESFMHSCVVKTSQLLQMLTSLIVRKAYQIFNGVWAILPLWRRELVVPSQDHTQHQHLFPVPEGRRAGKQRVHDHPWTPSAGRNQRSVLTVCTFIILIITWKVCEPVFILYISLQAQ